MNDDDLSDLRLDAAPRRSDGAFTRAVAADVEARRGRKGALPVLVPLLAPLGIGLGIFAFVALHGPSHDPTVVVPTFLPDGTKTASPAAFAAGLASTATDAAQDDPDAAADDRHVVLDDITGDAVALDLDDLEDDALVAFADPAGGARDREPLFAFDGLDGSTDRELDDVEDAFDAALAAKL
jgi:hypothetical protein